MHDVDAILAAGDSRSENGVHRKPNNPTARLLARQVTAIWRMVFAATM